MRVVVMGVTGCGKSTVGMLVAEELGAEFADADDFHTAENVAKMAAGTPLTDEDRWPWLEDVAAWLASRDEGVVACSALKRSYRDLMRSVADGAVFVHLAAPQAVLEPRVRTRAERDGHFAPPGLLDSQYATLEGLAPDEEGVTIDVSSADARAAADAALASVTG
ncbi:gluconokinase [Demequina sp. NBRC 110056]|uniref:gluconokinase n=1 Tax=Demequina sp. NBRC 110056 TaxID=1570345 RepID=UPI000A00E626|nr:gluconokinase [Demequina sp. NBRC 110056]